MPAGVPLLLVKPLHKIRYMTKLLNVSCTMDDV